MVNYSMMRQRSEKVFINDKNELIGIRHDVYVFKLLYLNITEVYNV
jgi:hypothetical protein